MEENKTEDEGNNALKSSGNDELEIPTDSQKLDVTGADSSAEVKTASEKKIKKTKRNILNIISGKLNVYLLMFILLIVLSVIIIFFVSQASNKEAAKDSTVETQELTQEAIDSLSSNEATVGDPKQLLTVESNSVFSGSVLVEGGLEVAGPIKVGGDLNLPGITVSGKSAFDEVEVNTLSVAGDLSVKGVLTVQQGLTVNGNVAFASPISAPSINVDDLAINGDVKFTKHIDAGGSTPKVSAGSAIGSGGTVTISGTDTAGTVTANIGSGPSSGTIATISFSGQFSGTPHVVVTPINRAAPNIYVASRTSSGFTIRTSSALPTGSISFDFIVID